MSYPIIPDSKVPKKKHFWRWIVAAGVAGLFIGGCSASVGSNDSTTTAPSPTVTQTIQATQEAVKPSAEPTKPKSEIDETMAEGIYEIGKDAKAGRYKMKVPDDSYNCYWARTKDDSGNLEKIIANENLSPGAKGSVTVKKGEFFTSDGCGVWERQ